MNDIVIQTLARDN